MKRERLSVHSRPTAGRTGPCLRAMATLLSLVLVSGCATTPVSRGSANRGGQNTAAKSSKDAPKQNVMDPPAGARPNEVAEYRAIQRLYSAAKHEDVISRVATFERRMPNSPLLGQARNLRALSLLATRRPLQASQSFQSALAANPDPHFRQYVLYNLASSEVEAGQVEDAQQTLARIEPESLDRETRIKYHALRARIFERRELPLEASREILALSRLQTPEQVRAAYEGVLKTNLKQISSVEDLEKLYNENSDSSLADMVLFRLGTQELILGRPASGEARLRELMSRFPQTSHLQEASDLIRAFEQRKVVEPRTVGVLLPSQGKYARFGNLSLQAIELAFRIYNQDVSEREKVTLVIEDSGEEPDQTVRALNRLFFKHHVIAVIGPLLSKGIDQVTQRAQELGLPLISLAQQAGINGEYVFPSGLTPQAQAEAIARYAIQKRGLKRFAILHPRDRFGEQYSQAFWDAVEQLGGKIVGVESYASGETDFRQPVQKLVGTYYLDARQRELDEMAKVRTEMKITRRTRKTAQYFDLPPIVDFDAVFIPDEPKVVGQILPTFAFQDVDKTQFLGIATWHSQELVTRAQSFAEGALFVDGFSAGSDNPEVLLFVERYRATFGQEPGAIEAVAYDAARMLEDVITERKPNTRDDIVSGLQNVKKFPGVTGSIDYRDGRLSRGLTVFTVQKGAMVEVKK